MIGSDILDIGTRKARRQRGDPFFVAPPAALTLGAPGQFDLPNVPDVSQILYCDVPANSLRSGSHHLSLIASVCSPLCIVAVTLPRCAEPAMKVNRSSSRRGRPHWPSSFKAVSLSASTLDRPWAPTFPVERSRKLLKSIPFCSEPWRVVLPTVPFGSETWVWNAVYTNSEMDDAFQWRERPSCWPMS